MDRNAAVKLGAFAAVLAASFGVGLAAGVAAGPIDTGAEHMPADPPTTSIVHAEDHDDGD